jgi:hypothetical protein
MSSQLREEQKQARRMLFFSYASPRLLYNLIISLHYIVKTFVKNT